MKETFDLALNRKHIYVHSVHSKHGTNVGFWKQTLIQGLMSPRQNNRKRTCRSKSFVSGQREIVPPSQSFSRAIGSRQRPGGTLLDQRPGLIIVTTLVGFVLFDFSHVFRPGIALAWLDLWKRGEERRRGGGCGEHSQTGHKQCVKYLSISWLLLNANLNVLKNAQGQ